MRLIEIPTQIFIYRLERILKSQRDIYRIARVINDILMLYLQSNIEIKTIKVIYTFDSVTILIGKTIFEYTDNDERKWVSTNLCYEVTEEELNKMFESVK